VIDINELRDGDEIVWCGQDEECFTQGNVYKVKRSPCGVFVLCTDGPHPLTIARSAHFKPFIQQHGGWIGVDLDGTLAVYDRWRGPYHIGAPIPAMVERVRRWLTEGRDVRIFTARVTELPQNADGTEHDLQKVRDAIRAWCKENVGQWLPITNVKDWHMMELWDDRAVQVRPNTGVTLADELEAISSADSGKAATP
jgi:hypothetical protein